MSRLIDLTGLQFGNLIVDSMAPREKGKHTYWNCTCLLCGSSCRVDGVYLRNGEKQSCGCDYAKRMSKKYLHDLTGNTYGDWTVIKRSVANPSKPVMWLCRCVCGTERDVLGSNLKQGYSTGCGCRQRKNIGLRKTKDLSQQVFGYLKVIEDAGSTKQGGKVWRCLCTRCGKQLNVTSNALLNGNQISCGCIKSKGE